ncbi:3-isopropylmalate dehydratase small subunit [Aquabacter spiritensis]|uniref:3-isopropylmalate dehydratase small subunit n=1 Tax=Aquabacter spiritensis TaxID=933073 RepID=A0A4V2UXP1_9HYPH|nr:3-isopropylmalate dehydratase small subunit [Aquabacter spiritensis]TCT04228.1 3-isopropylmalate dehydratase small subunit [Aquabacter spiritensis]
MRAFVNVRGTAAPIPLDNVNTDVIAPKELMRAVTRKGLGWGLFRPYRFAADGTPKPDFVLNRAPWNAARILAAYENFGCGSSREHAAWALADFGIQSVIAVSFAEIFANNCIKNRILPVALERDAVAQVMACAEAGLEVEVDLPSQSVRLPDGRSFGFAISERVKHRLLNGIDDIADTMAYEDDILAFEAQHLSGLPWLRGTG